MSRQALLACIAASCRQAGQNTPIQQRAPCTLISLSGFRGIQSFSNDTNPVPCGFSASDAILRSPHRPQQTSAAGTAASSGGYFHDTNRGQMLPSHQGISNASKRSSVSDLAPHGQISWREPPANVAAWGSDSMHSQWRRFVAGSARQPSRTLHAVQHQQAASFSSSGDADRSDSQQAAQTATAQAASNQRQQDPDKDILYKGKVGCCLF